MERTRVFYAYDRRVLGQDHDWVKYALAVTVYMLYMMVLESNLNKTKSMVCTPIFIW